jgi:hypothetical protein
MSLPPVFLKHMSIQDDKNAINAAGAPRRAIAVRSARLALFYCVAKRIARFSHKKACH